MATEIIVPEIVVDETDSEALTGEVVTPLDALRANERVIAKGLKTFDKQSIAIETTKAEVGEALYNIYHQKLWKAVKHPETGKALYKSFGEYLKAKGWDKTASRAYQLMAEHRKSLPAGEAIERKRGPKSNDPGRSAQTMANAIRNLRDRMRERAEGMDTTTEAGRDFVALVATFVDVTEDVTNDFDRLADRERGSEKA